MPWSPTFRNLPDARFDQYRNRCAALHRAGDLVGHVLVLTDRAATQRGGRLWWRRWEPDREYVTPMVQLQDGRYFDVPLEDEEVDRELAHWSQNKFPLLGELLDLAWLTPDEALEIAPDVFGVAGRTDDDGHTIWSFPADPAE